MNAPLVTVGMDGSVGAFRALDAAAAEAQVRGARLEIVYCVRDADEAGPVLRAARARVARRLPGLPVTACAQAGDPAGVLARRSRSCALTVVGSRGRTGLPGLPPHSVGRRLAARTQGPLLVVRGRGGLSARAAGPRRVLMGLESDDDAEAVLFAFEEAQLWQAPLNIVQTWTYRPPAPEAAGNLPGPPPADAAERPGASSPAVADRPAPPRAVRRGPGTGAAAARIRPCGGLITATGNAGLIVVAAHRGGHPWKGRQLGPVTDVLLRQSLCPVVVVPVPGA
ncbi:universal stress protein [Streptomyces sp. NPDC020917]|uniref:universal stress protein n=1 Tax=Streptomyces sp. NPDC020917 TaxID=3365102 RepID=UPI00378CD643